jgi:hypothetical protein
VDALVSSFERVFPDAGIAHGETHDLACERLEPFLKELLFHLDYEGGGFVLDAYHVTPRTAAKIPSEFNYRVVFLGYPGADPQARFEAIRRHARPRDWSERLDDTQLTALVHRFIEESRTLQVECGKHGLPFVDTGGDLELAMSRALTLLTGHCGD